MSQVKTVRLTRSKVTKNMVKFDEQPPAGEPPIMNNLYLAKWFVGNAEEVNVEVSIPGPTYENHPGAVSSNG